MDRYLFRRYALFVLSLFINALGVAFITKALLGTSPITSVNYVLSMFTPLTMGQWTILLNLTFVLLDLLFMTREDLRRERTSYLLQIPISLSFGLFIDCAMLMLFWLEPVAYAAKLLWLIVGCFILAAGIALEVRVNVAMTAGEYLVQVICRRHHFDFGYTKLAFDLTLVLLACLLSPAAYGLAACLLLGGVNAFWPQFLGTLVQAVGSGAVFTVLALALDRAGGKARLAPHSQG